MRIRAPRISHRALNREEQRAQQSLLLCMGNTPSTVMEVQEPALTARGEIGRTLALDFSQPLPPEEIENTWHEAEKSTLHTCWFSVKNEGEKAFDTFDYTFKTTKTHVLLKLKKECLPKNHRFPDRYPLSWKVSLTDIQECNPFPVTAVIEKKVMDRGFSSTAARKFADHVKRMEQQTLQPNVRHATGIRISVQTGQIDLEIQKEKKELTAWISERFSEGLPVYLSFLIGEKRLIVAVDPSKQNFLETLQRAITLHVQVEGEKDEKMLYLSWLQYASILEEPTEYQESQSSIFRPRFLKNEKHYHLTEISRIRH